MSDNSENTASNNKPADKSTSKLICSSDTRIPKTSSYENSGNKATEVGNNTRTKSRKQKSQTGDKTVTKPTIQSWKKNEKKKIQTGYEALTKPARQFGKQNGKNRSKSSNIKLIRQFGKQNEKKKSQTGYEAATTTRKSRRVTKLVNYSEVNIL